MANCEAQDAFAGVVEEHAGQAIADQYRTPWNLSDSDELLALFRAAGLAEVEFRTEPGTARYPSVATFLAGATGILVGADLNTQRLELDTTQASAATSQSTEPWSSANRATLSPQQRHSFPTTQKDPPITGNMCGQ